MSKWLCVSMFIFISLACNREEKNIIPRKNLVPILVDLHITDAIAANHLLNEQFGGFDSAMLYNTLFEKYGTTKEIFLNTLRHYSKKSDVLVNIYDDVFSQLSKMSEEAGKNYSSTNPANTTLVWKPDTNRYQAKGDSVSYPPVFDIDIDTQGTFVIIAEVKITRKDSSVNPRITAFFYRPGKDSVKSMEYFKEASLFKTDYMREYRLVREYKDKLPAKLRIIIPEQDSPDTLFMKSFEMQNLHLSLVKSDKET